jgi:hypothetical protein
VIRPTAAVLGLLLLAPVTFASLEHPRWPDRPPPEWRSAVASLTAPSRPRPAVEAQVTEESEVYLDGRRCEFKDVPDGSVIEKLVLAEDGRTVLRIDFRGPR